MKISSRLIGYVIIGLGALGLLLSLERLLSLPIISGFIRRKLTRALGMDSVRIGISGAAPLSTALLAWYQRLGIEILEGYAMSENFAYSHSTPLGESKIGYVGRANPMVDCKISEQK